MKIVLLTDVAKVGKRGEVREVSAGYAENVLFPRKQAAPATLAALAAQRAEEERRALTRQSARAAIEAAIARLCAAGAVTLAVKADEHGTLFEGLRADRIAAAITKEAGVLVAPSLIHLEKPIKSVGDYELRVGDDTTWTMVRVTVRPS